MEPNLETSIGNIKLKTPFFKASGYIIVIQEMI